MKKILFIAAVILSFAGASPASAASWTAGVQAAINSGNYGQIDVIAANNPGAQGDIAAYLLQQAVNNKSQHPDKAAKIFDAATSLGGQIPASGANTAAKNVAAMLALANDPNFQKNHPHEAASVFGDAISLSGQLNIAGADPKLHDLALAEANDFLHNNPDLDDKKLNEEVSLALGNDFLHNNPDISTKKIPDPPSAE